MLQSKDKIVEDARKNRFFLEALSVARDILLRMIRKDCEG